MCEDNDQKCIDRYPFSITRSKYECLVRHVKAFHDEGLLCVKNVKEVLHLEPNQQNLPVPRSFDAVDLPSDFVFDPALDPDASSSGASTLAVTSSLVFLIAVATALM